MDIKFNTHTAKQASYDIGLRTYMISVYNYMALALLITGVVAWSVAEIEPLFALIFHSPLHWVVMFAPLVMVWIVMPKIINYSLQKAQMMFWIFAALMGVSLAYLFKMFTGESLARTFFITASVFGAMSLYGYTTKKDLSGMGSFLMMGLIGIVIASLVNIFMQSPGMSFVVSILGVLIFTGLTAYDTQEIKNNYYRCGGNVEVASKIAIYGALSLYMDAINLFIFLLRLFGERR